MARRTKTTSLVTGGSGILGSRLVKRLLEQGNRVKVLDNRYGELGDVRTDPNLEFVGIGSSSQRGGMLDKRTVYRAIGNVDVIYHLAINWNGYTWKHRLPIPRLLDVNIRGTVNLLEAARSRNIAHFLVASSAAVYGETQRTVSSKRGSLLNGVVNEESVCKPYLWSGDPGPAYAVLKLTIENLCLMYYITYRMPVTVFRIEYAFANKQELKDGANIHVEDVASAFLQSTLDKRTYGQVFNVAYPVDYISVGKIQSVLGWKPEWTTNFLRSR